MDDVLTQLGTSHEELLGEGGEAKVYALDESLVVRIHQPGESVDNARSRKLLLDEIAAGASHLWFDTPEVIEVGTLFGHTYSIERRIDGESLIQALRTAEGATRARLINRYMDAAWATGKISLVRPSFGEVAGDNPIECDSFSEYLAERAGRSLADTPLAHIDAQSLAKALGEPVDAPSLVHLDFFAGNVMADGDQITGVIDFGYSTIIGDRRLTPVAAAVHLVSPRITPVATDTDRALAMNWIAEHELGDYYSAGEQWMAAYWMFASADDPVILPWSKSVLDPQAHQ